MIWVDGSNFQLNGRTVKYTLIVYRLKKLENHQSSSKRETNDEADTYDGELNEDIASWRTAKIDPTSIDSLVVIGRVVQ